MKTYELTYIVTPEITQEEAEAKAKEMESSVASREGVIIKQVNPIAKTFSYPLGKSASGFLGVLEFQLEPEKLTEIKDIIGKDGKIVRHMVIIKKPVRIKPGRTRKSEKPDKSPEGHFDGPATIPTERGLGGEEPKKEESKKKDSRSKIELKDIEQELDEILN